MGFLKVFGNVLEFENSKQYHNIVRMDATKKIIIWVNQVKDITCCPKFGYEVSII